MPTNSNKVKFNYISRASYTSLTKDDNTFYTVEETNGELTLYLGSVQVGAFTSLSTEYISTNGGTILSGNLTFSNADESEQGIEFNDLQDVSNQNAGIKFNSDGTSPNELNFYVNNLKALSMTGEQETNFHGHAVLKSTGTIAVKSHGLWFEHSNVLGQEIKQELAVDYTGHLLFDGNEIWDAGNFTPGDLAYINKNASTSQYLRGDGTWGIPPGYDSWRDIDDTPVDGHTDVSISSNWAYDHANSTDAHPGYLKDDEKAADSDKLDNLDSSSFLRSDADDTMTKTLTFSTDAIPIAMQENHFINRRFEMLEATSPQYILLCNDAASNDVNGRITMDRTSGNYQAVVLDVIVSSNTTSVLGGGLKTLQSMQSSEVYQLVKVAYNGTPMIAIKYTGNTYPETSGAYFTGRIVSTGSMLTVVDGTLITAESVFNNLSKEYHQVNDMIVSGKITAVDDIYVSTDKVWHAGNLTFTLNGTELIIETT